MKKTEGEKHKKTLELVQNAIEKISDKVERGTCSDLVRLIQLREELEKDTEPEEVKEIKVTWVEPEMESVGEG